METLDAWEPNSALQPQAVSWATYPLDGYDPMLEEGVSDSETSLDSARPHALYFEPSDVKLENPDYAGSTPGYAVGGIVALDAMGWSYSGDGSLSSVMSPTSESDDTMRYGVSEGMHESGDDETTHSFDDPSSSSSEEDMALNYNDGEYAYPDEESVKQTNTSSSAQAPALNANGRPVRSSARGEQMKQVQEMIRQVNSAVESVGPSVSPMAHNKSKSAGSSPASHNSGANASNSKKRARVEPDLRSVTLTREQLLTMTSEELDTFTERLKADHPLSPHEMRELKRQRRLIKNREYAQASRVKKKVVLSDLGSKFSDLENERNTLAIRVQALEIENTELRRQLGLDVSKRNLGQFIIGGNASTGANPFSQQYRGANGATGSAGYMNSTATGQTQDPSHSAANGGVDGDYLFQPPKAKRTKGRQNMGASVAAPSVPATFSSRAAIIGGGMSLFAVVLLAVAVFTGAGTPFFASPISSPHSPIPAPMNYPVASGGPQTADFKTDSSYSTFRTMDILATTPDPTLDPNTALNPTHIAKDEGMQEINLDKKQEEAILAPTSTIVSMDELLAAEDMIYATTNASLPEEEIHNQHQEEAMQQQA